MKRLAAIALSLLFALGLVSPAFGEESADEGTSMTTPPVDSQPPAAEDEDADGEEDEDAEEKTPQ